MIKKLSILLAIFFVISCSLTGISANNDISDNIAINEDNSDNLEQVSTASNFTTLQQDIYNNSEIVLSNNVTMSEYENNTFTNGMLINKAITIDGNGYTINANNYGRIFLIADGCLTLKNTVLINGISDMGGAIFNNGNITIINCTFNNNNATTYGGAIFTNANNCTVINCTFINNTANYGGAIFNNRNYIAIINSNFINNNVSTGGGAIFNSYGYCTVTDSSFINNTGNWDSGAICNEDSNCTVTNCSFINNSAGSGGAIWNVESNCTVINCSFINNSAIGNPTSSVQGGAIFNSGSNCTVINCSFINNSASNNGGAISGECTVINCSFINNNGGAISGGIVTNCSFINNNGGAISGGGIVTNCIFINNTGGAISISSSNCTVTNCSFINNTRGYGGAICIGSSSNCTVTNCSFINNTAPYCGGAISMSDVNCTVINCSFINNTAGSGGAIYNNYATYYDEDSYKSSCMICDCVFDNILSNTSEIYLIHVYSFLRNNTFHIKENMSCIESEAFINSPVIATVMDNETANVTLFYRYNVKVVFTDDNGNIIGVHNNASVLINESKYDLINNGTYSYCNYKSSEVGNFSIGAVSDFLTNLTVKNGTLEVLPNPIELIINNLTKYYNDTTKQLIATLTYNKTAMVNETITFIINGKEYNRTTDSNGIARININLNPGIYTVKAFYNDSDVYVFDVTVTVLTTINASDLVKIYRNASQFYATFYNINGTALAGTNVTFNINGVWYTRTTNNNGTAKLNINLDSGKYVLTAVNPLNKESKGFNITVLSTINSTDIIKYFRNGTQYMATFKDIKGNILANTTVKFNINGVFYTKTTNEKGIATLNINLQPGKYILTAINPITNETIGSNVLVKSVLVGEDLNKTKAENKSYEVKVLDGQGNPLANQTVKINIHGVFYNKTTDENGIAKLAINLDIGEYIITTTWNDTYTLNKIFVK